MGGQSKVIKKKTPPPPPPPFEEHFRAGLSSGVLLVVVHKCISFAQVNGCVTGKIHVFG